MKMKNVLGIFSDKYKDPSVCESCGDEFTCGATLTGCWCMNVQVTDDARVEMKGKYQKCLCPKCLGSFSEELAMVVRYPDGRTEIVTGAMRVDEQNFHEGMYDFYDERGNLLKQISMSSGIKWEMIPPKTHDQEDA